MEVGISERKSIQKQRWVFVGELGNSNPPIKSASIRFPSSQRSREAGFVFNLLILLLGYGSKYSAPNGWMIGNDP